MKLFSTMDSKRQSTELQGVRNETLHSSNKDVRDDESNNSYAKEDFESFAQDTTLHGARYLFTDNVFRRFFWALAVIASLAYCIFQAVGAIKAFYEWPFSTKISKNTSYQNNELLFPAVTLCNLNSVNTRRYKDEFRRYYSEETLERKIKDLSILTTTATDEFLKPEFKDRNQELFKRLNRANDTLRTQGNLSHQIGEMLLPSNTRFYSCSINGKPCTEKNFTRHMSSTYGQCYTFNSADNDYPLLHATLAGQNSGLKLHLNIERNSYIKSAVRPSVGLAMIVHDQKSFPFMGEYGMAVQPGVSTLCVIKRKKMINLPKPYETNCVRDQSLKDMFSLSNAYVYTKKACLIKCRNDYTIDRCGCIPPEYKASAPFCAPNDTILCVHPSYEEFSTSKQKLACEQSCPEPCEHVEYETAFSYSGLHTETLHDYLMEFLNNTANTSVDRTIYEPLLNMTQSEREKYIEKNVISLNIYFEDLSYEVIKQTPVYKSWALIGNLGGTFGLFLGMSLLTMLEFIDFIFRRIFHFLIGLATGQRRVGTIHAEK